MEGIRGTNGKENEHWWEGEKVDRKEKVMKNLKNFEQN